MNLREKLISIGVIIPGKYPTYKKSCAKCGAEFDVIVGRHDDLCGSNHRGAKPNEKPVDQK